MLDDLADKRILVTGASTGIGAAAATALAAKGAILALHYNASAKEAEAVAKAIRDAGGRCHLVQGDLSRRGEPRRVVEEAARALGGLDILINNAGSLIKRVPFEELPDEMIDSIFDLNARSVIAACQAALPHLEKAGGGSIINVGSIAGSLGGGPGASVYGAAKAFVHNLTRHLAGLYATKNIRVNAIAPGVILTPFHAATPPDRKEAMRATVPMGRLGTAEDCVGAFLFLASNRMSGYVTGQVIHVNGGQLMA
ncbi:MAG: SDR family NAD(P)-dependent oxidoreductase [Propylenella sp.]